MTPERDIWDGPFAQLMRFAQRHRGDPAAELLEQALWQWFERGQPLDEALGLKPSGAGPPWRHRARLSRRDGLIRDLYRHHLHPVSLRSAGQLIQQDWLTFNRRHWPRLCDQMPPAPPRTRAEFFWVLKFERHEIPGLRQLITILRPCAVAGVQSAPD